MTTIDHGRSLRTSSSAVSAPLTEEVPSCPLCLTDDYLIFEEFVPARQADHSTELLPASASYTCSECGTFNAHAVPASWRPPQWFWYN
ncbi:hypothetical protein [Arthrobacter sp. SX1312]|uniref:hypothetical protein n=1 Tax=Arthrobacter sp. SX1312 TaxID=2058896 RepID=UPI000CE2E81A|nr:hypothetical protein [Arthrobacter sp. SX1312]